MNANEIIQRRREELGMSQTDVASGIGVTFNEYFDIEAYPDEIFTAVSLDSVKKLCHFLSLDITTFLRTRYRGLEVVNISRVIQQTPRNELVRNRRKALNLSKEELGDLIGFYKEAIDDIEKDESLLDGWPIENIVELSKLLNINPQYLFEWELRGHNT